MDYYLATEQGDEPMGRRNSEGSFYDSWTPGIAAWIHTNRDRSLFAPSASNQVQNGIQDRTDSEQARLESDLCALLLLEELQLEQL